MTDTAQGTHTPEDMSDAAVAIIRAQAIRDARDCAEKGGSTFNSHAFFVMCMGEALGWDDAEIHRVQPMFLAWGRCIIEEICSDLTEKNVAEFLDRRAALSKAEGRS
jgi:hypothetical protein